MSIHDALSDHHHPHGGAGPSGSGALAAARRSSPSRGAGARDGPEDLFPDIPEAKKRKFILVEDSDRQSRLRVRVTLDGVDTHEIPDSFRKSSSVYPRSYFPREMQSPPPSATGSRFFADDASDDNLGGAVEDDGTTDTEGRGRRRGAGGRTMVKVPLAEGREGEVAIPCMRRLFRGKEVRLNDLGYRMAWLQSRVFAGRTVFLQRAREFSSSSSPLSSSHFPPHDPHQIMLFLSNLHGQDVADMMANSGLLPQQDAQRDGVGHAGRQDGRAALRDARRQAQVERAHARRREGGRVIKKQSKMNSLCWLAPLCSGVRDGIW